MTKSEKEIVAYIDSLIPKNSGKFLLKELKSMKGISQHSIIKSVIRMIFQGKINITPSKREREDFQLCLVNTSSVPDSSLGNFKKIIQSMEAYYILGSRFDLNNFINYLPKCSKDCSIIAFLKENKGSLLNLKIICRWVVAYWSGQTPLPLSELGLSPEEMMIVHQEIAANNFFPSKQELLDIKAERSGYFISGILRSRLVEVTYNRRIAKLERIVQTTKGLYIEKSIADIPETTLFYNREEEDLFYEILELASQIGPNSNSSLTLLLHGVSGTGKTEFVYQLARQLKGGLIQLNFSEIQSKFIGETEKNIQKVFDIYQRNRIEMNNPLILLINEADGLMNKRVRITSSNDAFHNQTQTILLELLENSPGIIIATTNQVQNLDTAFNRRFMFKQEIRLPEKKARISILKHLNCQHYIDQNTIELLENNNWSPGMLMTIMGRIKRLSMVKTLNNEYILSMFKNEGMITSNKTIGFRYNSNIKKYESRT